MTAKRKTGGHPSDCTPEMVAAICKNLEIAMPYKYACEAEGVPWPTMETWMQRGKRAEESGEEVKPIDAPYVAAYLAFRRSQARSVRYLTRKALAAGKGSSQAQFLLERRYREYYGPHQRVELTGKDGGPIATDDSSKKLDQLTLDELRRLAGKE